LAWEEVGAGHWPADGCCDPSDKLHLAIQRDKSRGSHALVLRDQEWEQRQALWCGSPAAFAALLQPFRVVVRGDADTGQMRGTKVPLYVQACLTNEMR
jgi:hypothetical protein